MKGIEALADVLRMPCWLRGIDGNEWLALGRGATQRKGNGED
jgi:hypothetical protein